MNPPTSYELRAELLKLVRNDLLGPAGGAEEIVQELRVRDRYLVGKLAPRSAASAPDEDDQEVEAGTNTEEGRTDPAAAPALRILPSAIGMTFTVSKDATALQIIARYGRYKRISREEAGLPESNRRVWKRVPHEGISDAIPLQSGTVTWQPDPDNPEISVQGKIRDNGDEWIVTLYLVNGQTEPKRTKDAAWLFQPQLVVKSPDGAPIFMKRFRQREQNAADGYDDLETRELQMLYRHNVEFGVGHGVAIHAELHPDFFDRGVELRTEVMPTYEVPRADSATARDEPLLANLILDMKVLAGLDAPALVNALSPLADAYAEWITRQRARVNNPLPDLAPFSTEAHLNLERCENDLTRIRTGIALLGENVQAADAFRFAMRAMYLQRLRSQFALAKRQGRETTLEELDTPENHAWRPFQLAFILLNLPALTNPLHPDRSPSRQAIADLLWFPTGGGKTEAYLGLTAYTLAIRRLQKMVDGYEGSAGVAVLMRYTLRLLTLQQFQRATALICACEVLRRQDVAKWGETPFRIGLWVGMKSTPNWTKDAKAWIAEARNSGEGGRYAGGAGTPHQLTNCPWCGWTLNANQDLKVEPLGGDTGRTLTTCSNPACDFNARNSNREGLPVVVVDEEIYRLLPSLLIATVDKFAQMPWKGETQMLFGRVNGYCERHGYCSPDLDCANHQRTQNLARTVKQPCAPLRPPDLIIQDELHLINGPLGSLVGLYEMAVDYLASWNVQGHLVRPKLIASSATIRQAPKQVHQLYLRRAEIFPPSGLDVDDNFFAKQRAPSPQEFGRLYVGVCGAGEQNKAALIRVYLAFLSSAQRLYEQYGGRADAWMTLVGYFNAIRELGGTRRIVEDEISSRLKRMDERGLANRFINAIEELTSRKSATDIPQILDRLEAVRDPQRDQERKAKRKANERINYTEMPLDVLLATNMISVGVDVARLGLMVVYGQPKNTAEYIQATSRIGRSQPGIVCTLYNWARPRDMSHYERFEQDHATFYQQVEALSVTPVSAGALRRGLTGVLVAYVRLLDTVFNRNDQAGDLVRQHPSVSQMLAEITRRVGETENPELADEVRRMIEARLDKWLNLAQRARQGAAQLEYKKQSDNAIQLLRAPTLGAWNDFTVLNSLRDVELPINLVLREYDWDSIVMN